MGHGNDVQQSTLSEDEDKEGDILHKEEAIKSKMIESQFTICLWIISAQNLTLPSINMN